MAVAAGLWGCDAKAATPPAPRTADGPSYTERVKIDDV